MYELKPQPETAQAFCDSLGIDYHAVFVPQSQSRNKDDKNPSLNWRVAIGPVITDYTQGIGHLPGYKFSQRRTLDTVERERAGAEQGKYFHANVRGFSFGGKRIPAPKLVDVLYCLVSDSDVLNYSCFEDWASEFGFDADSRKAEKLYRDCLEIALQLRQVIDLEAAREAFEDF